jgi:NHL repeat
LGRGHAEQSRRRFRSAIHQWYGGECSLWSGGFSFITNSGCNTGTSTTTAGALCQPQGVAVDAARNLFIADTNNHRVLEFDGGAISPFNVAPTLVVGQTDFTLKACVNAPPTANTLCKPAGVAVDASDNLYVLDQTNQRVLEYNNPLTTHAAQPSAQLVFGQGNSFITNFCDGANSVTINASTLCGLHAIALDASGNLWVSDSNNSRVLEFLDPLGTDTTADLVLGQPSFTSSGPNSNNGKAQVVSATSISVPEGIVTAPDSGGTDVFVVDNLKSGSSGIQFFAQNDRVLRYKQASTNGQAANGILGQLTFSNFGPNLVDAVGLNSQGASQTFTIGSTLLKAMYPLSFPAVSGPIDATTIQGRAVILKPFTSALPVVGLNSLESVAIDSGNHLYVSDSTNNRVLGWKNAASFANGQAADLRLGQPDFNSSACNQGLTAPTASTFASRWAWRPIAAVIFSLPTWATIEFSNTSYPTRLIRLLKIRLRIVFSDSLRLLRSVATMGGW